MNEKGIEPIGDYEIDPNLANWLELLQQVFPRVRTFTETLNPASVAANTTSEQTFTVNGLTTSDIVNVNKPSHTTGLGIGNARVSNSDELAITFINTTAGAIDPAEEDYYIVAIRR